MIKPKSHRAMQRQRPQAARSEESQLQTASLAHAEIMTECIIIHTRDT